MRLNYGVSLGGWAAAGGGLEVAHRPVFGRGASGEGPALVVVFAEQEGSTVPFTQATRVDQSLGLVGELEQAYEIADCDAAAADSPADFGFREPRTSHSVAIERASSIGVRSWRAMFSMTASSCAVASSRSRRTIAGTVGLPIIIAARQRRSPATSWYRPLCGLTIRGSMTPLSSRELASPTRASWSTRCRGWSGLRSISPTGMSSKRPRPDSCGSGLIGES